MYNDKIAFVNGNKVDSYGNKVTIKKYARFLAYKDGTVVYANIVEVDDGYKISERFCEDCVKSNLFDTYKVQFFQE